VLYFFEGRCQCQFACFFLVPAVLAAQEPDAPNLEQILAKHFEAMGGLDKLASVKTVRITTVKSGVSPFSRSDIFESAQLGFTYKHYKVEMNGKMLGENIFVTTSKGGWRANIVSYCKC